MKLLALLLTVSAMFASCSSPKYSYYFDRYPTKNKTSLPKTEAPIQFQGETLVAGTKEVLIQPAGELVASNSKKLYDTSIKQPTAIVIPNDTVPTLEKKPEKGKSDQISSADNGKRVRDKGKNWMAIAGFFSVIVGTVGILTPLWVFYPVGFLLCKLGLRSEKRGWALGGIVIGLTAAVVLLVILLAFIFSGGSGFGG